MPDKVRITSSAVLEAVKAKYRYLPRTNHYVFPKDLEEGRWVIYTEGPGCKYPVYAVYEPHQKDVTITEEDIKLLNSIKV